MKTFTRSLWLAVVALCLLLPLHGEFEVGGGGDTGIWILPRSTYVGSGSFRTPMSEPRASRHVGNLANAFVFQVGDGMDLPTAIMTDPRSQITYPVATSGRQLTISAGLLAAMRDAGASHLDILVIDGQRRGYLMQVVYSADRQSADVLVY